MLWLGFQMGVWIQTGFLLVSFNLRYLILKHCVICLFLFVCLLLFLKGNDNTIVLMWLVFISEQRSGVVKAYVRNRHQHSDLFSHAVTDFSNTVVCFCLFSLVIARKPGEVLMIHLYYSGLSFFFLFFTRLREYICFDHLP